MAKIDFDKNTWIEGMDQDTSKSKFQPNKYYELRNGHAITHKGTSTGSIENEEGTTLLITLPTIPSSATLGLVNNTFPEQTGLRIIGWIFYRNDLIVISTTSDGGSNGIGHIWLIPFNIGTNLPTEAIDVTKHLKFAGALNLNPNYRIKKIIPRYEFGTHTAGGYYKIYFTDGHNGLRHLNLYESTNYHTGTKIIDIPVNSLEVLPNIDYFSPVIFNKVVTGGSYTAGMVQYSYQYYKLFGVESRYSPASKLVHLTNSNEYETNSSNYFGAPISTFTGKAVKITIPATPTDLFDRVRVVSLFYETYTSTPEIKVIADLDAVAYTVSIIDTNAPTIDIAPTLLEFTTLGGNAFICQDMEVKDNRLLPVNITTFAGFNPTWDSRAYRFNSAGVSRLYTGSKVLEYTIWNSTFWNAVPATNDCYNLFNEIKQGNDADTSLEYMYQADGVTLGGEGPNIRYEFVVKSVIIDEGLEDQADTATISKVQAPIDGSNSDLSYTNYASPYIHSEYVGYMRDEVVPFAIVFFDTYGRQSFANWIADVRFPRMYDVGNIANYHYKATPGVQVQRSRIKMETFTLGAAIGVRISVGGVNYDYSSTTVFDGSNAPTLAAEIYTALQISPPTPAFGITTPGTEIITTATTIEYNTFYRAGEFTVVVGLNCTLTINTVTQVYMPDYNYDFCTAFKNDQEINYGNILGIKFTLKSVPLGATAYKIIRCPITSSDRTVAFQGLVEHILYKGATPAFGNFSAETFMDINTAKSLVSGDTCNTKLLGINSPDPVFFKTSFTLQAGDFISLPTVYNGTIDSKYFTPTGTYAGYYKLTTTQPYVTIGGITPKANTIPVKAMKVVEPDEAADPFTRIGDYDYRNYSIDIVTESLPKGHRGSNVVVNIDSSIPLGVGIADFYLVNYKRNIIPYGGNTFASRTQRVYIPCTDTTPIDTLELDVYGGDTYISFFSYLRNIRDFSTGVFIGNDIWIGFPVETRLNLELRHDQLLKWFKRGRTSTTWDLEETQAKGLALFPNDYPEDITDLYLYNSAYSKENDVNKYYAEPLNFTEVTQYGTRIKASEKRISGNTIDQYLDFSANVYKDVDSPYGDINAVKLFKNQLFFFQDSGIGVQPVNERATVVDESGTNIVLGEGEILGKYGYISRTVGCKHPASIVDTDEQLHFFDVRLKKWYMYDSSLPLPLSSISGMHSYFGETLLADYTYLASDLITAVTPYGVHGIWDVKNNRILMTFLGSTKKETVVYNLFKKNFEQIIDFSPILYVQVGNSVLGVSNGTAVRNKIYQLGTGNYGTYFEVTTPYDTVIKFISNKYPETTKIYSAIEYNSLIELSGTEYYDAFGKAETFNMFRMLNDHQTTGFKNLVVYNETNPINDPNDVFIKRRFRIWRFKVPRSLQVSQEDKADARMRGQYTYIELRFTNSLNKRLILHDVTTHFIL
jgi:hypothetical protein